MFNIIFKLTININNGKRLSLIQTNVDFRRIPYDYNPFGRINIYNFYFLLRKIKSFSSSPLHLLVKDRGLISRHF